MFEGNKVCQLLNIKYPILQGGMAWASSGKLASSVSNAGGLGIIGCAGRDSEWVLNEIDEAKNNTKNLIGLNVALNDDNAVNIIEIAVENDIKFFTMGGTHTYLKLISRFSKDVLIIPIVGSATEAKLAERAGAKLIICEGQESGGSIGGLSLFSLLPQVADAVKIPVIAAGGIADSRGLIAAFALGAQGIQMGTRFLASKECSVNEDYKNRIIQARDIDSMVISRKIKRPTRVLKNKFAVEYLSKEQKEADKIELSKLVRGRLRLAVESDVNLGAMHAGEISGLITDVKSTREIIEEIVAGYSNNNFEHPIDNEIIDTEVSKYLKHKPPILLVDKILDLEPGILSRTSLKLGNDKWFFDCHYPDYPVMPGTLLVEAMSQTMSLAITSMDEFVDKWSGLLLLSSISNVKFKKEALPGIKLIVTAKIESIKRGIAKGNIKCEANAELICSSSMTIVIPNAIKQLSNQIRKEK
jgi:enoyl-[acyl-carrier protein] reductase II